MTGVLSGIATDLLSAGKRAFRENGIGLSASSRQLTQQFLNNSAGAFDGIFSAGNNSIQSLQTTINALRAGKSNSQLARQFQNPDEDVVLKSQTRGVNLDEEV